MHAAIIALLVTQAQDVHWYDRIDVSGYVDIYYGFDTNRPLSGAAFTTGTGTTAKRANEFSLNIAALDVAVNPTAGQPVALRLVLNYGTSPQVLYATEPMGIGIGADVFKFVQQAYAGYLFGWLLVEFGVFPSHIGFETLPSKDNWTYTRAWMSDLSPYYQAGVRAVAAFPIGFNVGLYLLNGWQIIGENNDWKTVGTHIGWSHGRFSVAWNTLLGPEPAMMVNSLRDNVGNLRAFSDLILQWDVTQRLALAATWDAGLQERTNADTAAFHGGALYARVALLPSLFFVLRGDYYHDADGVITGVPNQTLAGVTGTFDVRAADRLILKIEGRYDHATQPAFDEHTLVGPFPALGRDQGLFVVGAVASF